MPGPRNGQDLTKHWRAVLMGDPCVYCGNPPDGLDHIVPLSAGGTDGWANRAPACHVCDQQKGPASLLQFLWASREAIRRVARRTRYRSPNNRIAARRAITYKLCHPLSYKLSEKWPSP